MDAQDKMIEQLIKDRYYLAKAIVDAEDDQVSADAYLVAQRIVNREKTLTEKARAAAQHIIQGEAFPPYNPDDPDHR